MLGQQLHFATKLLLDHYTIHNNPILRALYRDAAGKRALDCLQPLLPGCIRPVEHTNRGSHMCHAQSAPAEDFQRLASRSCALLSQCNCELHVLLLPPACPG